MIKSIFTLCLCTLAFNLAANPVENEEGKDLSPGALICNQAEDRCEKDEADFDNATLFSFFCPNCEEENQDLACKGKHRNRKQHEEKNEEETATELLACKGKKNKKELNEEQEDTADFLACKGKKDKKEQPALLVA